MSHFDDDPLDEQPGPPSGEVPSRAVLDAEDAVVGAALHGRNYTETAAEILTPEHFYQATCSTAFAAALDLAGGNQWIDVRSIVRQVQKTDGMKVFGNSPDRVYDLANRAAIGLEAVRNHAQLVVDDYARRAVWRACIRGVQLTSSPAFDAATDTEIVLAGVQAAAVGRPDTQALLLADDFGDYLTSLEKPDLNPVLPTPWSDVNERVRLRGGQLVVIGARPGGGKSLAGLGIATHTAIRLGLPSVLFSLEMPRAQLTDRIMAAQATVSLTAFEERKFTDRDWMNIADVSSSVRDAPMIIDDATTLTVPHVRTRLRWMQGQGMPAAVVVIDYIQQMKPTDRHENRVAAVGEISRELKKLAMEFNVPIVALTQLNRASEARADKKPAMSDLRESGAIENDADIVMLLHRPLPPTEEERAGGAKDRSSEVDVLVEKQRQGVCKIEIPLVWQAHYARLSNFGKEFV
jgi:replicative DNA helicase